MKRYTLNVATGACKAWNKHLKKMTVYISGCSSLCNETIHVEAVTCDGKTVECKYTCNQGYGGDHCQYHCDYNCLKCGSDLM